MSATSVFTEAAVLGYTELLRQLVFFSGSRGDLTMAGVMKIAVMWAVCFIGVARAQTPYVFGAIGDSISAGFNSSRYGDNREFSWTAGQSSSHAVLSHALKIQQLLPGRRIEVHNEAFVGADSSQLARQTTRLLRVKPDYVTVAIGANDVCVWTEDYEENLGQFERHLSQSISRIIEKNQQVKIVLAPVPSIPLLREIGARIPGCQAKWDTIDVCRPLLDSTRSEAQRQAFADRYHHLNQVIEAVSTRFKDNVRFADALMTVAFDASSISMLDCFHPSLKGHQQISDSTFNPSWF